MRLFAVTLPLLVLIQCSQQNLPNHTTLAEPRHSESDTKFAHVFAPLDGTWAGEFIIYEHTLGQEYETDIPGQLTSTFLSSLALAETNRINVNQMYESKSPYYQTVHIMDTYLENDQEKTIASQGVNKVENGKLWCIVQKPSEKIIHQGTSPSKNVIVWQGQDEEPFRKEYFYESVFKDTYEIVGYGYYGQDNPAKNPRLWFHGQYQRVQK